MRDKFYRINGRIVQPQNCETLICEIIHRENSNFDIDRLSIPYNKKGYFNLVIKLSDNPKEIKLSCKREKNIEIIFNISEISVLEYFYHVYKHNLSLFFKETNIKKSIKELSGISIYTAIFNPEKSYFNAQKARISLKSSSISHDIHQVLPKNFSQVYGRKPVTTALIFRDKIYNWTNSESQISQIFISKKVGINLLNKINSDYIFLIFGEDRFMGNFENFKSFVDKFNFPEIIYFDHFDTESNPYFKPDWNFYYFLHYDYISRAVAFRTDFLKKLLEKEDEIEINSYTHYKLILKAYLEYGVVPQHVPLPLFILTYDNSISDWDTGLDILKNYFKEEISKNSWENTFLYKPPLKEEKKVSIIIPTKDKVELLSRCVYSILEKTSYKNFEIIIVDNGSQQRETFEFYEQIKDRGNIKILSMPIKFNFSKLVNYGIKEADGEYIVLMNNDTEVINEDWLEWFVRYLNINEIGVVGAKLFYPDGKIQHAGVVVGLHGLADHAFKGCEDGFGYMGRLSLPQEYLAVTAACMGFRKEVFDMVGGFEEELEVNFNDLDFCLKVYSQGYKVLYLPQVQLIHYEHASRGKDDTPEKIKRAKKEKEYIQKKWKKFIDYDPYYNPNLTIFRNDFSPAPPRLYWLE